MYIHGEKCDSIPTGKCDSTLLTDCAWVGVATAISLHGLRNLPEGHRRLAIGQTRQYEDDSPAKPTCHHHTHRTGKGQVQNIERFKILPQSDQTTLHFQVCVMNLP